jgi:hypothetical protein
MMRSISSAVRRFVTSATTRRCPPHWQRHTSQPNVLASKVAQSIRGGFCFFLGSVETRLGLPWAGVRITAARSVA